MEVQPTLSHDHMGNSPSLPGLGGGRTHGMRYTDGPDGSRKGRRPEGIPAVETELIEVLEPSVSHKISNLCDPDPLTSQTDRQTDGRHGSQYRVMHYASRGNRLNSLEIMTTSCTDCLPDKYISRIDQRLKSLVDQRQHNHTTI